MGQVSEPGHHLHSESQLAPGIHLKLITTVPPLNDLGQVTPTSCSLQFPPLKRKVWINDVRMIAFRVLTPITQLSRGTTGGLRQGEKHFFIYKPTYVIQKLLGFLGFLIRTPTTHRITPNTAVSFNKQLHHLSRHRHPQPQDTQLFVQRQSMDGEVSQRDATHLDEVRASCLLAAFLLLIEQGGRASCVFNFILVFFLFLVFILFFVFFNIFVFQLY